jgi:hypothetical protein
VLEGGEVVERGTHSELMARNGLYRQIYESQLSASPRPGEDSTTQHGSDMQGGVNKS